MSTCICMGPQRGQPLCPCMMRAAEGYQASVQNNPHISDKAATEAAAILSKVRAGQLDPRPAAVALGLPFDQDTITAILELAASSGCVSSSRPDSAAPGSTANQTPGQRSELKTPPPGELIERLESHGKHLRKYVAEGRSIPGHEMAHLLKTADDDDQAASTIRRLEGEVERLRGALEPFADQAESYDADMTDDRADWPTFTVGDFRRAHQALSTPPGLGS